MNKFVNRISELFGLNDVSNHPELYYKQDHGMFYDLDKANTTLFHDSGTVPRNLRIRNL
jgi:hypothetical protein